MAVGPVHTDHKGSMHVRPYVRLKSGTSISTRYFKEDIPNALYANRRAQKEH